MKKSNKEIVIIDYGLGNLFSVNQACQSVGLNVKISNIKEEIITDKVCIQIFKILNINF